MRTPEEGYLQAIVFPLLSKPDEAKTDYKVDERGIVLFLSVAKEDIGRVIGRDGATAISIRRLVRQYGMGNEKKIAIKIIEPTK